MICLHLNTAIGLYRFVYIYTLQLPCIALFTATHCNCLVSLCLHLHTAIALYRFVYIYTLQLPCIAWIKIKGSVISLHVLVTNLHFTDPNWISKSVISKAVLYAAFRTFSYANHMKDYTGKENPAFLCDHVGFTSKNVHFFCQSK